MKNVRIFERRYHYMPFYVAKHAPFSYIPNISTIAPSNLFKMRVTTKDNKAHNNKIIKKKRIQDFRDYNCHFRFFVVVSYKRDHKTLNIIFSTFMIIYITNIFQILDILYYKPKYTIWQILCIALGWSVSVIRSFPYGNWHPWKLNFCCL